MSNLTDHTKLMTYKYPDITKKSEKKIRKMSENNLS